MPNKILVTGGLGLIGHNLSRQLESSGHEVVVVDTRTDYGIIPKDELDYLMNLRRQHIRTEFMHRIDIADQSGIEWIMRHYRPEIVVHLASFPRQKVVNIHPQIGSRAMSEGLLNLLENSAKHDVRKFVYVSSSMVYGDFTDNTKEDAVCQPKGQYGIMKLAGEWLVQDYEQRTDLSTVIVRPSAVYGPRDVEDRVVSKFLIAAMRGETIKVKGANEKLDFTYVDDVVNGIAATLADHAHGIYNITRGHARSLLEAAELAIKIAGRGVLDIQDRDLNFPSRGQLNIEKARKDLGFDPKIDIEQGFQIYYEWLVDSLYWSKKTVS